VKAALGFVRAERFEVGWSTGFEPATARSTIWGSNQAELRPPLAGQQASFLPRSRQVWTSESESHQNLALRADVEITIAKKTPDEERSLAGVHAEPGQTVAWMGYAGSPRTQ